MSLRPVCLTLIAAAGLAACATPQAPAGPVAAPMGQTADAEQEAVYGVSLGRAGLTARVNSNGCTKRADFRAQVLDGYPAPTVILHRIKPDLCRALVAGGVDLLFDWSELNLRPTSQIVLANPLVSDPSLGRR